MKVYSLTSVALLALFLSAASTTAGRTVITIGEYQPPSDEPAPASPRVLANDGPEGGFVVVDARYTATLPADQREHPLHVCHADGTAPLAMQQLANVVRDTFGAELARVLPGGSQPLLARDTIVRYPSLYPNTVDEYAVHADRLKHDWVLQAAPSLPSAAAWFGYEVRLTLPAGATLEPFGPNGQAIATELTVADEHGEVLYELPAVETVDAAGRQVHGHYRLVSQHGQEFVVAVEVAADWLTGASYPVRIDPTIVTVDSVNTAANTIPLGSTIDRTYQQTYSAGQMLNTEGEIERFGFQFANVIDRNWTTFRVYMGESSRDSNTRSMTFDDNFDVVSRTLVYDGTMNITTTTTAEYGMITLQTPFYYSGQNTLVVELIVSGYSGVGSGSKIRQLSGGPIECYRLYASSTTATAGTSSTSGFFLHARFEIVEGPTIQTTALDDGCEGFDYSKQIEITGGIGAVTITESGLPPGLTLDPTTGEITGVPTAADVGTHSVTITATDANNNVDDVTLPLFIDHAVVLNAISFPEATETGHYPTVAPTSAGGRGPFTWAASGLPSGLSIDPDTGEISGIVEPFTAGPYSVSVTIVDTNGANDTHIELLVVNSPPRILSDLMPRIQPGSEWGPVAIEVEGGTAPLVFSADDLPQGLTLDPDTGELSGTVDAGEIDGVAHVMVGVTDARDVAHVAEITFTTLHPGGDSSGGCGVSTRTGAWLPLLLATLFVFAASRRMRPTAV